MNSGEPISLLMFGTLLAVLLIAIVLFVRLMRQPANMHPMEGEPGRNITKFGAMARPETAETKLLCS